MTASRDIDDEARSAWDAPAPSQRRERSSLEAIATDRARRIRELEAELKLATRSYARRSNFTERGSISEQSSWKLRAASSTMARGLASWNG